MNVSTDGDVIDPVSHVLETTDVWFGHKVQNSRRPRGSSQRRMRPPVSLVTMSHTRRHWKSKFSSQDAAMKFFRAGRIASARRCEAPSSSK